MPGPIIYVDSSDIQPGKLAELRSAIGELAGFLQTSAPRLQSYNVYVDAAGQRMTVVHVHPDAASLDHHLAIAGPLFPRFRSLVRLRRISVLGEVSEEAMAKLRDKARLLGSDDLEVQVHVAGFVRPASMTTSTA